MSTCTMEAVSSATITMSPTIDRLPSLAHAEVISHLEPEALVALARCSRQFYAWCRRLRAYPLKSLSVDVAAGTATLHDLLSVEPRTVGLGNVPKRIYVLDSFEMTGFDPSTESFPDPTTVLTLLTPILPLLATVSTVTLTGLLHAETVRAVLAAASKAINFDISSLCLSQPTEAASLFSDNNRINAITASGKNGVELNENFFELLRAKSWAGAPLQTVTVYDYFNTNAIVAFAQHTRFAKTGTAHFVIKKENFWTHYAHLHRHFIDSNIVSGPQIAVNGTFLNVPHPVEE